MHDVLDARAEGRFEGLDWEEPLTELGSASLPGSASSRAPYPRSGPLLRPLERLPARSRLAGS
jgi:hypothetical protein